MLSALDPAALAAAFGPHALLLAIVTILLGWLTARGQRQTQLAVAELQVNLETQLAALNQETQLELRGRDQYGRSLERAEQHLADLEARLSAWQGAYWAVVREVSNAQREGRAVNLDRLPVPNGARPPA